MNDEMTRVIRAHFESWSGGFPPDSEMEIFVYVEYAREVKDADLARTFLRAWMAEENGPCCENHVAPDAPILRIVADNLDLNA